MSIIGAIVVVFVILVAVAAVVLGVVGRSRKNQFESQVRQSREAGCTCDYTFVEAWGGDTNTTRKADCPVHGRGGKGV